MSAASCESCMMPIAKGPYCSDCVDGDGKLQPFEDRFQRMLAWQARLQRKTPRAQLERTTLAYMAAMPAWKNHPRIKAEFPGS
jgi:hypothetical protein